MKRLRVRDRVITSHAACTSGNSRVLAVASLQRLKTNALIPAPAGCEVRSVITFLNAQNIAAIKIYRQLCQIYGPNVKNKQMVIILKVHLVKITSLAVEGLGNKTVLIVSIVYSIFTLS